MALLDNLFGMGALPGKTQHIFDPASMTMVEMPADPYASEDAKLEAARRMQMKPAKPLPFAGMLSDMGVLNMPGGAQSSPFDTGTTAVPFASSEMTPGTAAPPLPPPQQISPSPAVADATADAAIPPNAKPTQAEAQPGASFLENISDRLKPHALTLMALGAGFAGAPSFGTGMSRAFSNAIPAASAEQKMQIQQQGIAQTYKALVARGVPPQEALAAVYNPEVLKTVAGKYFEAKPLVWQDGIGRDPITGEIRAAAPGKIEKVTDANGIERSVVRDATGQLHVIDAGKLPVMDQQPMQVYSFEQALKLPKGTRFRDTYGVERIR